MIKFSKNNTRAIAAVAMTTLTLMPGIAAADMITLSMPDNTLKLSGEFLGFDQNAYVVEIAGTQVRVPVGLMHCEGADCLGFQPVEIADAQG